MGRDLPYCVRKSWILIRNGNSIDVNDYNEFRTFVFVSIYNIY